MPRFRDEQRPMNGTPRVFLGSSTEVAEYMRALETELGGMGFATVPWHGNFGVFVRPRPDQAQFRTG